jgi:hypothetical protein
MIDDALALNNRGIDQEEKEASVTLAAANLGSCDKNPGKADTTLDTGAIVRNEGGNIQSWVDPRGSGAKSGRDVDKGGIRPAAGKK